MKNYLTIFILLIIVISCGNKQNRISGPLDVPDALFEYSAEGEGLPLVIFTGGENIGQKLFPKELKESLILIHADPRKIDSTIIKDLTFNDILKDLEKLRNYIAVEKIGILGHSMFGLIPFEYALKFPNNISFAISTGSQPFINEVSEEASRVYWEEEASVERKNTLNKNWEELENIDWSSLSPTQLFITMYTADTPFRFYDPNFDQSKFWEGVEINRTFLTYYWRTLMKDFDNSENYKNIKSPVLVLSGKYDFGAPYYLWEKYDSLIPNLTLKVYDHAGHNPFMEIPDEFTKDVLAWVKEIN